MQIIVELFSTIRDRERISVTSNFYDATSVLVFIFQTFLCTRIFSRFATICSYLIIIIFIDIRGVLDFVLFSYNGPSVPNCCAPCILFSRIPMDLVRSSVLVCPKKEATARSLFTLLWSRMTIFANFRFLEKKDLLNDFSMQIQFFDEKDKLDFDLICKVLKKCKLDGP